jgi:hypothetical protein
MASNFWMREQKRAHLLNIAEAIESTGGILETDALFERMARGCTVLKQDADLGLILLRTLLINPIFPAEYIAEGKVANPCKRLPAPKDLSPRWLSGWAFANRTPFTAPILYTVRSRVSQ